MMSDYNFYTKYCLNDIGDHDLCQGVQTDIPLQCSTRGIGFGIVSTLVSVQQATSLLPQEMPVFQLYRVSLAFLENKMERVYTASCFNECYNSFINLDYNLESALLSVCRMPKMISGIVDSLGTFTHSNTKFVPIMAPDRFDNNNLLIPDAGSVYFSNLRSVVRSLSDSRTPFEARERFVKENSIPGARFSADCILENPDDIMPDGYNVSQLRRDIVDVNKFYCKIERSNHECSINWIDRPACDKADGTPVCSVATKRLLFIPSAPDFATLQRKGLQNIEETTVYSPIKLKPDEWLHGAANFHREPPSCLDDRYPFWDGCSESYALFRVPIYPYRCIYQCYNRTI